MRLSAGSNADWACNYTVGGAPEVASADAFVLRMNPGGHVFEFWYSAGGSGGTWTALSTLLSPAGVWFTAGGNRFRHRVSYAKLQLTSNWAWSVGATWAVTYVAWNSVPYDTDGFWNGSAFIAPYAGYYSATFSSYNTAYTGSYVNVITLNGNWQARFDCPPTSYGTITWTGWCNAGDSIQAGIGGANASATLSATQTWLSIVYLGE
jgi:hypothetical protein